MTEDTTSQDQTAQPNGGESSSAQPSFRVLAQYVKDLSFENPGAPQSLSNNEGSPKMDATVNVQAKQLSKSEFECEIKIGVSAKREDQMVFLVELVYAGVFQIVNVPQDQVQQVVFIECPRQLFPFARRVVADATRDGGFPPLLLDPIDFVALYQQQLAAAQKSQATSDEEQTAPTA